MGLVRKGCGVRYGLLALSPFNGSGIVARNAQRVSIAGLFDVTLEASFEICGRFTRLGLLRQSSNVKIGR